MFGVGGGRKQKPGSPATGLFGMPAPSPIGSPPGAQQPSGIGGFVSPPAFLASPRGPAPPSFGGFGSAAASNAVFGQQLSADSSAASSLFGVTPASAVNPSPSSSLFGQQSTATADAPASGSLFSSTPLFKPSSKIPTTAPTFAAPNEVPSQVEGSAGLFGPPQIQRSSGGLFGKPVSSASQLVKPTASDSAQSPFAAPAPPSVFGSREGTETREPGSRPNSPVLAANFSSSSTPLFGGHSVTQTSPEKNSLFGKPGPRTQQVLFGKPSLPLKQSATAAFLKKVEEEEPVDFRPLADRVAGHGDPAVRPLPDLFPNVIEQDVDSLEDQAILPRASIKSRLGAIEPASTVDETVFGMTTTSQSTVDESVFSKPRLSRPTPIFPSTVEDEEQGGVSETESEVSSEGGGSKKGRVERTVSREELAAITSILCEAVPGVVNKQDMLTKHFSKFGDVVNVVCNVKRKSATVTFTDHRGARKAKEKGKKVVSTLPPISISYSQQSPRGDKVKSRLEKVEKPRVAETPMTVVTNTVTGEGQQSEKQLLAIMQQATHSDGDRWTVLEARDKYMRLRQPRSVTRSGVDIQDMNLVGTCPDFCPEKERYERSAKNRLEWYEKATGGKLSHTSAVKEHSRSAADQGIPLPHELRPAPVLSRTMDYLMCNVLDRIDHMAGTMTDWFDFVEQLELQNLRPSDPMSQFYVEQREAGESAADWFVFMWDRIRAVRKDISQQNLSDLTALSIVEKCAR